jgi:hypothetical protein
LVVRSGNSLPPHPCEKATKAQRQHEQRTDESSHIHHDCRVAVANRFEERPGEQQAVEQQDEGSGTPKTGRLSASMW